MGAYVHLCALETAFKKQSRNCHVVFLLRIAAVVASLDLPSPSQGLDGVPLGHRQSQTCLKAFSGPF